MTVCECADPAVFVGRDEVGACRCPDETPPEDPFLALRVTFGMLLGEEDFRVLMGNPRGKQMLHNAWLHGAGVVWGLGLTHRESEGLLEIAAGLALDARGRELRHETASCLVLEDWVAAWTESHPPDPGAKGRSTATGWVVARARSCLDRPVPAVADPCDVTRRHDDYSRVVETVHLEVVDEPPPCRHAYPRVRALLGVLCPVPGCPPVTCERSDCPGAGAGDLCEHIAGEVDAARLAVTQAEPDDRSCRLLEKVRLLAARDSLVLVPERVEGRPGWPAFPRTEENSGVVLARFDVPLDECARYGGHGGVRVDHSVRTVLLPTSTVQDLTCALAPGLLGVATRPDAGGPRLRRDTVDWSRANTRLQFKVTAPIAEGSQERGVQIASLADDGTGWSTSDIDRISLGYDPRTVIVDLNGPPAFPTVRVVIRGTGPTPMFGADPHVPFAGVEGGPSGTADDGFDAVITETLYRAGGKEERS